MAQRGSQGISLLVVIVAGCARLGYGAAGGDAALVDTRQDVSEGGPQDVVPRDGRPDVAYADRSADAPRRDSTWADGRPPDKPSPPDKLVLPLDGGAVPGTWLTIYKGTFTMGSPAAEPCRGSDEDLHAVTLTHNFEIQTTEVTQGQFQQVLGYNPATFKSCGASCPVETITWNEAAAYGNALSERQGLTPCYTCTGSGGNIICAEAATYSGAAIYVCPGYRLPTDAEWEYAYRAATTSAYYSGPASATGCTCTLDPSANPIAWYCGNAGNTTHAVAQKQANAWGLYDMGGNVLELGNDLYVANLGTSPATDPWGGSGGGNRVWRGGAWAFGAGFTRGAYREKSPQGTRNDQIGFRCVRTVP
jgi:formylglycine-generating enzyme required for sulfatase activity